MRVRLLGLTVCVLLAMLSADGIALAQNGPIQGVTTSSTGQPRGGVNVAVCATLTTTAASITNNVATYTFGSNPQTAGFATSATFVASGFTGGDTFFNTSAPILSTSATTISIALVHANASAGTNGSAYQTGSSTQACAPLASLFTDNTGNFSSPNPFTSDGLGNYLAWAAPNYYRVQLYGPGVTTFVYPTGIGCVPANSVNCGALLNANNVFTGTSSFGSVDGLYVVDGARYATLNAAFAACNASALCTLWIPPGSYSFSTQIAPTSIAYIQGAGASYQNAGAHCITTLTWTGGASAPFLFTGTAAHGSHLGGFCLNATGAAPPVFVDNDNGASDVELDHIVIDMPTTPASVAAFRWGNTGPVVDPTCNMTFARAAAPIGYDVLNVQAKFTGTNCRSLQSTANEWVLGGTNPVLNFSCVSCSAEASSGIIGVLLNYVRGASFVDFYSECGGAAGAYCVEATAGGTAISDVNFYNPFFSGVQVTGATAAIHLNSATSQLALYGGVLFGTWPNPNYCVKNDSQQAVLVSGCRALSAGGAPLSSPATAGSSQWGNLAAGAPVAPTLRESLTDGASLCFQNGAAAGNSICLSGSPTGPRVATFPDVTDTVVELAQTQILSNKKFSDTARAVNVLGDQGAVCTNVELALSAGWQSTGSATVTAVFGTGQSCSWTITTGTTTAANPTVTDTLTNALPTATTDCEMNIHGGTHTPAAGEGFTYTGHSATAPIFTFIGTPTAGGTTYFVTRRCGP